MQERHKKNLKVICYKNACIVQLNNEISIFEEVTATDQFNKNFKCWFNFKILWEKECEIRHKQEHIIQITPYLNCCMHDFAYINQNDKWLFSM